MTKVFDFIDFITDLIDKFFTFLGQLFDIFVTYQSLISSFLFDCPPLFVTFFSLFLTIAIALFIWRLIP